MIACNTFCDCPDHTSTTYYNRICESERFPTITQTIYGRYEPDEVIILEDVPKYSHICINVLKSSYKCDRAVISRNRLNTFILSYSQRGYD